MDILKSSHLRKNTIHIKEEIEKETSFGTTHHSVKMLKSISQNNFYTYPYTIYILYRNHKYHKIFNRNNVKISYSCMNNLTNIIGSHNKKVTNFDNETNGKRCNCRNKSKCRLDNKCLTNKTVYKPEVKTNDGINDLSTKVYFDISKTEFKSRYNNNTMSFRNWTHKNDTKLLKYIWSLKN